MEAEMKYPIGVQSFENLRESGYVYIDKTGLIYTLVKNYKYVFFSRPRRFGKSLLMSTIECYFKGKRELFEGLAISELENDWTERPVFHFDLNSGKYDQIEGIHDILDRQLSLYESLYGRSPYSNTLEGRFEWLIRRAYETTGHQCVILVDEYDKPILSAVDRKKLDEQFRNVLKPFYGNLKSMDRYIRFGMLTGVSKFAKLSIFSDLNNLEDISLSDDYPAICGLTEDEILKYFDRRIDTFAISQSVDRKTMIEKLRAKYDGYRFSEKEILVYNPFSVLNSLKNLKLKDYWFETGTPSYLVKLMKDRNYDLSSLEGREVVYSTLVDVENDDPISLLYQSGYLTIGGYDDEYGIYTLRYPNQEVKSGFLSYLLPSYSSIERSGSAIEIFNLVKEVKDGDVDSFMERVISILAGIPYTNDNSVKMQELQLQNLLYLIFKLMGLQIQVEYRVNKGRIDAIVHTESRIYILEFKIDSTPETAISQIEDKGYAIPFLKDGRKLILIGINYSTQDRNISYTSKEL